MNAAAGHDPYCTAGCALVASDGIWRAALSLLMLYALVLSTGLVMAQPYPTKPVRLVVPFSPAGVADFIGRVTAEKLGQRLGQNVVIFNRDGGGSVVGTELVARSTPDGYTVLLVSSAFTMNAAVSRQSPYDVRRDFAPIGLVFEGPGVLVVHPSVPANSVQDLVAYARANPGKLRYGSSGVGSVINLVTELFKYQAKVDITHVPYKGVAPAVVDLVGGQIEMVMAGISIATPLVKSGKLKALGITVRKRSPVLPDVRPISEQGLPDFESSTWYGLLAPSATPPAIVARLSTDLAQVINSADVRERFASQGGEARSSTREEFVALIDSELRRWQTVVKAAGLRAE
jgi:tripartite-type tricarboxylate transporter receptor subunit TctC